MNKYINAVQFYYGFSIKEAKKYIKNANIETLEELQKGYEKQCKLAFYND